MVLNMKNLGLPLLMVLALPSMVMAAEGDQPCHHNLGAGQHHAQQHQGDKPCDHEKGGHGHHKQGDEPCDKQMNHAWRDGLTDQQLQQIDAMHEELSQQQRQLREKIWDKQQQTRQMILMDEPDIPVIRALSNEISMWRSEIAMRHLLHLAELRKMLTREQQLLFDQEMRNAPHHHD
jgi:Spy/CpxP family protein refolding chaperone